MTFAARFPLALLAVIALPVTAAHAQNLTNAERQLMIENIVQADGNSDGVLSRSEFETLINLNAYDNLGMAARVANSGRYGAAFNRLDANGDGYLTQQEIQALADARG